jgi:hypothetical protein
VRGEHHGGGREIKKGKDRGKKGETRIYGGWENRRKRQKGERQRRDGGREIDDEEMDGKRQTARGSWEEVYSGNTEK